MNENELYFHVHKGCVIELIQVICCWWFKVDLLQFLCFDFVEELCATSILCAGHMPWALVPKPSVPTLYKFCTFPPYVIYAFCLLAENRTNK